MFKTHIIKKKDTNLNKKAQIRVIQKIIGSQFTLPLILFHQISMFLFKNPLVLAKPLFVKVQRPISILYSENVEYLIRAQHSKKLKIIGKWKAVQSDGKAKAISIRAAETFLNVFQSFFAALHPFVNNKNIDGEFQDHFRKNNLYAKQLHPCISNLLRYYKQKVINLEITNSILNLIRNDIVFFEVEGQKKMWVIGGNSSLKNQGNIQQLACLLSNPLIMDQNQQHCSHIKIFQKKSQITMRGEQRVLNNCDEQITLFDCYLDVNQGVPC